MHNQDARPNPALTPAAGEDPLPVRTREDLVFHAGATYAYRGPVQLSLTYGYTEQASGSFGESFSRHRLSWTAGVRFLKRFTALAQLAVQQSHYPDGVFLSPEIVLLEDDESHNSGTLKVSYTVSERLDVEARAALYQNRLPGNDLTYFREVVSLGVTARFP